jgi:hypothetical protein
MVQAVQRFMYGLPSVMMLVMLHSKPRSRFACGSGGFDSLLCYLLLAGWTGEQDGYTKMDMEQITF